MLTDLLPAVWPALLAATPQALIPEGVQREIADAVPRLVESWPVETIAIPVVVLVAGFALWAAGRKLIRPVFGVLGLALGAGAGYLVVPQFGWQTLFGLDAAVAGLIGGALIGLLLALLLYRLMMGLAAGGALAFVALLAAGAYLHANPSPPPDRDPPARSAQELLFDGIPLEGSLDAQTRRLKKPENAFEEARVVAEQFRQWASDGWEGLAVRDRVILLAATLGALTIGLAAGLAFPTKAAALVSAPFGAAVALSAGAWLLWIFDFDIAKRIGANPALSLVTWGVVAAIGVFIQLGGRGKSKPKRKDDGDDDEDE